VIDGARSTIVGLLDVRPLAGAGDPDRPDDPDPVFRAPAGAFGGPRLFGGQVAGQALRAAALTVDDGPDGPAVASMRATFLRPGRPGTPTDHAVEVVRDGRSFANRRVTSRQGGDAILTLEASFHRPEPGEVRQPPSPLPDVPAPDDCPPRPRPPWRTADLVDMRLAERGGRRAMWIRVPGVLPDDAHLHACVLAFVSDMGPVGAVAAALGAMPGDLQTASLDHCLWFHQPARADGWLLYELEAVAAGGARGVARGSLWTADGVLAATVVQEVLVRARLR
jgi:acyl-CoA thioesterase-2